MAAGSSDVGRQRTEQCSNTTESFGIIHEKLSHCTFVLMTILKAQLSYNRIQSRRFADRIARHNRGQVACLENFLKTRAFFGDDPRHVD